VALAIAVAGGVMALASTDRRPDRPEALLAPQGAPSAHREARKDAEIERRRALLLLERLSRRPPLQTSSVVREVPPDEQGSSPQLRR